MSHIEPSEFICISKSYCIAILNNQRNPSKNFIKALWEKVWLKSFVLIPSLTLDSKEEYEINEFTTMLKEIKSKLLNLKIEKQ